MDHTFHSLDKQEVEQNYTYRSCSRTVRFITPLTFVGLEQTHTCSAEEPPHTRVYLVVTALCNCVARIEFIRCDRVPAHTEVMPIVTTYRN